MRKAPKLYRWSVNYLVTPKKGFFFFIGGGGWVCGCRSAKINLALFREGFRLLCLELFLAIAHFLLATTPSLEIALGIAAVERGAMGRVIFIKNNYVLFFLLGWAIGHKWYTKGLPKHGVNDQGIWQLGMCVKPRASLTSFLCCFKFCAKIGLCWDWTMQNMLDGELIWQHYNYFDLKNNLLLSLSKSPSSRCLKNFDLNKYSYIFSPALCRNANTKLSNLIWPF